VSDIQRVHLDTDLGSDTDDLCALAMLLGWADTEVVGVTTNTDPGGIRAGWVHYALQLAGRNDIPLGPGPEGTLSELYVRLDLPDYWPEPISPRPGRSGEALELLEASASSGATIVAVGPFTNLALLEAARPGLLADTHLVVMGGHMTTPGAGFPQVDVHSDFNVQQDRFAADIVFRRCDPVVVPLAATIQTFLREEHLTRLRAAGPLGKLLADQGELHERDHHNKEIGRVHDALPVDLLNFQHDPLACAVAVGWDGVTIEDVPTRVELRDERLWMTPEAGQPHLRVVTEVDGPRFEEDWLQAVERSSATA
jgi:inosine-uridine nucleoside N-ribohydrolase